MNLPPASPLAVVIDSDRFILKWLEVCLKREGIASEGFADPFEALRYLVALEASPALAFVEMDFPGFSMNGLTLLKIIRSREALRNMPVVMITGRDRIVDRLFARLAGAEDYLVKPLTKEAIHATVGKYVQL